MFVENLQHRVCCRRPDRVVDGLAVAARPDDPVLAQECQVLRDRRIPELQRPCQFANRPLAIDQLAHQHQPMLVRQRLEKITRHVSGDFHLFNIHFHVSEYTNIRIYCQERIPTPGT